MDNTFTSVTILGDKVPIPEKSLKKNTNQIRLDLFLEFGDEEKKVLELEVSQSEKFIGTPAFLVK